MAVRRRREYLQLLDASKAAAESAIDMFNRVRNPYRNEASLILLTNAWELLAKAVLVQRKESIRKGQRGETISAEMAVLRLQNKKLLKQDQAETIQQIISLRHAATHHLLPNVPDEVMQHLLFFSCKFFRELVKQIFPSHLKDMSDNYLSMAFSDLTTYADKVRKSVSRVKKSPGDKRLVWLLERGIQFDGSAYLTEKQFEHKYKGKNKVMPHLGLSSFIRGTDMVRIVPIEAPRNFTADVTLRKGSAKDSSLPVVIKKTDLETDYPFLTKELGEKVGRHVTWAAKAAKVLGMKGDPKYHLAIRSSKSGSVQRYSQAAVQKLQEHLKANPEFDPYRSY